MDNEGFRPIPGTEAARRPLATVTPIKGNRDKLIEGFKRYGPIGILGLIALVILLWPSKRKPVEKKEDKRDSPVNVHVHNHVGSKPKRVEKAQEAPKEEKEEKEEEAPPKEEKEETTKEEKEEKD